MSCNMQRHYKTRYLFLDIALWRKRFSYNLRWNSQLLYTLLPHPLRVYSNVRHQVSLMCARSSALQVSARHGCTVPSDILWADVNSCQPASLIHSLRPTDCSTHQNKLRRPQFPRPRTSCMEQCSCCTASTRHYTDNVQEQTEDIFV